MPLHDVGYHAWEGRRSSRTRWWVIAQTGIKLAWKSHWLRRMLFFAWLPAIYLGIALFLYERMAATPAAQVSGVAIISQLPHAGPLIPRLTADPESVRRDVWALILLTLFRYPQGVLMVLLVGIIAPPLIANDLRSRAYLLYFSRPINRADYVIGKSIVVWTYLFCITTVPALSLYLLGVGLSPSISVVAYTWDLPLRILGASLWLILPTTALALCYSSMTNESRYASYAWFATWAMGWVAYSTLTIMDLQRMSGVAVRDYESRWSLVSLYHSLGQVQAWIFGIGSSWHRVAPAIILLILLTGVSLSVLIRRVSAPLRV